MKTQSTNSFIKHLFEEEEKDNRSTSYALWLSTRGGPSWLLRLPKPKVSIKNLRLALDKTLKSRGIHNLHLPFFSHADFSGDLGKRADEAFAGHTDRYKNFRLFDWNEIENDFTLIREPIGSFVEDIPLSPRQTKSIKPSLRNLADRKLKSNIPPYLSATARNLMLIFQTPAYHLPWRAVVQSINAAVRSLGVHAKEITNLEAIAGPEDKTFLARLDATYNKDLSILPNFYLYRWSDTKLAFELFRSPINDVTTKNNND